MNRKNSAFTLVEILIVVIILGILAAIVIPQFTQASQNAQTSQLTSDLQTMRSQLELYKVQHGDNYPSQFASVGSDSVKFAQQLTSKTNSDGTLTGTPTLGPYLQKIPTNPFVTSNGNVIVFTAGGAGGWFWDATNLVMAPSDAAHAGL